MAKRRKSRPSDGRPPRRRNRSAGKGPVARSASLPWSERLLHARTPQERPWKYLPLALALAFAMRAVIALSGDFVLHPDEIMQYLEPAHRLVFGNGVTYWEYFYGARSWLVSGLVAGVLQIFDILGLGQPFWYVGAVKLLFCAISLAVPAGMYFFARWHFDEAAARIALLAGAFWYELVGFAHKPMTEFVASAALMGLLALCIRPALVDNPRLVWGAALLAVLAAAVRLQYAPVTLVLLGLLYLRTGRKMQLAFAATLFFLVAGIFDGVTWDGRMFHSWLTNLRVNLVLGEYRAGESPAYQFLWWLLLASAGLSLLCVAAGAANLRRYGLLFGLIALVLLAHSLQSHKEYRFIFAVIPLWLLIGADVVARYAAHGRRARWLSRLAGVVFAAVSLSGILNALPYQALVYQGFSRETGIVGFVRNQDPVFAAYRYLASASGVDAVWQTDRPYYNLPGYYYLHREIPFYDTFSGRGISRDAATVAASVSHIVSADPNLSVPGYTLEREFGDIRIWRRVAHGPSVRRWRSHTPTVVGESMEQIVKQLDANAPTAPPNMGIRFADE